MEREREGREGEREMSKRQRGEGERHEECDQIRATQKSTDSSLPQ